MSIIAPDAATPRYFLLEGDLRIGPNIASSESGQARSPIYGFSDRRAYERFWMDNQRGLTPYPLVKVFLRDHNAGPGEPPMLVVVDAAGPSESSVQAATTEAILAAQENQATRVTVAYRLTFDQEVDAYRIEEVDS